jgi:hypothetical protein
VELTCGLSTVIFVEGKSQRPHHRLVALNGWTWVFCSPLINSVVKRSRDGHELV